MKLTLSWLSRLSFKSANRCRSVNLLQAASDGAWTPASRANLRTWSGVRSRSPQSTVPPEGRGAASCCPWAFRSRTRCARYSPSSVDDWQGPKRRACRSSLFIRLHWRSESLTPTRSSLNLTAMGMHRKVATKSLSKPKRVISFMLLTVAAGPQREWTRLSLPRQSQVRRLARLFPLAHPRGGAQPFRSGR